MNDEKCCTPTAPAAQAATNSSTPNSTEGHKNPEWSANVPVYGQGGNVQ